MTTEDTFQGPQKLSLVIYSGAFDKVHYAFAMASAALAINVPTTLFFTMEATRTLLAKDEDGPGWAAIAAGDGRPGAEVDGEFAARGVATFEDLVGAVAALGGRVMVCEMGLRAIGLERSALRMDLEIEEGGLVTFLTDAGRQGQIVFI